MSAIESRVKEEGRMGPRGDKNMKGGLQRGPKYGRCEGNTAAREEWEEKW